MTKPNSEWIFLRGLTREAGHWYDFPKIFSAQMPDAHVHLIDLPGVGKNSSYKAPISIKENMEFVRKKYGEPHKKVWLLSISMGSMIALEWALTYPDEIAGVVSINTSIGGLSPFYERMTPEGIVQVLKITAEKDLLKKEELTLEIITNLRRPLRPIAKRFVEIAKANPVPLKTSAKQILAASRYRLRSDPPQVPVLFLRSLGDRLVNSQCSLDLARYWNLECKTHPTAGHDLPLDDAAWIVEKVSAWQKPLQEPNSTDNSTDN